LLLSYKLYIFALVLPNAESSFWVTDTVGHIHIKAFSERFGFDVLESRKFKLVVKNKATGTPLRGVDYICPFHYVRKVHLYIHRRGASSVARFGY